MSTGAVVSGLTEGIAVSPGSGPMFAAVTASRSRSDDVTADCGEEVAAESTSAAVTDSRSRSDDVAAGSREEVAAESSIVASRRTRETGGRSRCLTASSHPAVPESTSLRLVARATFSRELLIFDELSDVSGRGGSGEVTVPASADEYGEPGIRSGSAAEPGSTRSITVVSSAGTGRIEATSRTAPPVATTSAKPTTPPMISRPRRRPKVPGPR